jgi:hypothetical protein
MSKAGWIVLVVLVLALGGFIWWRRRKKKLQLTLSGGAPPPGPIAPGAAPPKQTSNIIGKFNQINAAGCAAAAKSASKGGLPSGITSVGCSTFLKYLTPVGQAEMAYKAVTNPVATAKAVGHIAADAGTAGETIAKVGASSVAHAATKVGSSIKSVGSSIAHLF